MKLQNTEKVQQYKHQVKSNPTVSICVQTYNHDKFISECLDGILMQETSFDFEILLGEDNSTDNTRQICIEYAKKHPSKIKLFLHDRSNVIYIDNTPTGRYNFIYNLNQAKGIYIALCEGDDYWTDHLKLQKQVDFLEQNKDYSICFHEVSTKNELNQKIEKDNITNQNTPQTTTILDLAQENYIHTPSVVFRNTLKQFPPNFEKSPVGDYFLQLLNARSGKIYKIKDNMAVYRIHKGGVWSLDTSLNKQKKSIQLYHLLVTSNEFSHQTTKILREILDQRINHYIDELANKKQYTTLQNMILEYPAAVRRVIISNKRLQKNLIHNPSTIAERVSFNNILMALIKKIL